MTPSAAAVTPARIVFDEAGVPRAPEYGDVYHSTGGGPAQSRHVFLAGNDLPARWQGRASFAILETGFGLGLNFLCAATAYLADARAAGRLHFVSVEKHPAGAGDLARAHAHWPEFATLAAELRHSLPPAVGGFHRIELAGGRVLLTLLYGEVGAMLGEVSPGTIDAFFLDGFAPEKNPAMWSPDVMAALARLARGGATAATWSVAAVVRAGLHGAGFALARRPGFGRKREMLTGRLAAAAAAPDSPAARTAIVIGAGLAGCWTSHALAHRGWDVTLLERHDAPASEASGNPAGALLPALNLADNDNARLGRAAFLHAARCLARFPQEAGIHHPTGLLQVALARGDAASGPTARRRSQAEQADRMRQILARHAFPDDFVRWMEADEGARRAGTAVGGPGWWFEAGGWVAPRPLCAALLREAAGRLHARFGANVARLAAVGDEWEARDAAGRTIARARTVMLANAQAAATVGVAGLPRLIAVRGQITCLPAAAGPRLDCVVCGDGYVAPLPDGGLCVGATFEPGSTDLAVRDIDHEHNLRRARRMLPGCAAPATAAGLTGRAAMRTATADRLPACGPLGAPGSGLHLLAGLGARGLVWAALCAEILAGRLEGEPLPVEASLVRAMRPDRDAPAHAES